jgi:pimeloyl-ACP methyl ester carboxylesterase
MDILLIAGLWLGPSIWTDVAHGLQARGHHAVPVRLPGQGDGNTTATLAEQVAAVVAAVDAAAGKPMVVGHSAACSLAWLVADSRPDRIDRLAMIGGFPPRHGERYADLFPTRDGVMPFPGWAPFDGADSADLDDAAMQAIASAAIPVPDGVARGVVELTDEHRYEVPVLLVCPEFTSTQAREWIDGGDVPELARAREVSFVDIDTGHWPMITAPDELAGVLADAVSA